MNRVLRDALGKEFALARALLGEKKLDHASTHLERAHVLGQRHVVPHVVSHWLMLRIAVQRRQPAAAAGQVARIVLGALGSVLGRVPTGNTGGTDISMFKRLPIAPELRTILEGRAPTIP